MNIYNIDDMN